MDKETKRRNNIISGLHGRILQERGASPTKSTLLDKSGHPVDRGFGEGINGGPRGALLPSPGNRRGQKVGPETAEPVQTPATHLTLMTPDQICPSLDIAVCNEKYESKMMPEQDLMLYSEVIGQIGFP